MQIVQVPQAFAFLPSNTSNWIVAEFNGETATGVFKKFTISSELAQWDFKNKLTKTTHIQKSHGNLFEPISEKNGALMAQMAWNLKAKKRGICEVSVGSTDGKAVGDTKALLTGSL